MHNRPMKTRQQIIEQAERVMTRIADKMFEHALNVEVGLFNRQQRRVKRIEEIARRMLNGID